MKIKRITSVLLLTVTIAIWHFVAQNNSLKPSEFKVSGAKKALDRWSLERVYPNQDIPEKGYFEAFLYSRKNLLAVVRRHHEWSIPASVTARAAQQVQPGWRNQPTGVPYSKSFPEQIILDDRVGFHTTWQFIPRTQTP